MADGRTHPLDLVLPSFVERELDSPVPALPAENADAGRSSLAVLKRHPSGEARERLV
jgi:hypothetical protein